MLRFARRITPLAVAAAMLFPVGGPVDVASAAAGDPIRVHVVPVGLIVDGGHAAVLLVATRCRLDGYEILEAFVYVNQDGGSTDFAGIPIACDGRPRIGLVRVAVFEGERPLHRGAASASAFVLAENPLTGDTAGVSPTFELRLFTRP